MLDKAQLDVIVIGASAGGLEALQAIVRRLPAGLPAAILIVVHTRTEGDGYLAQILARDSRLPVEYARHQDVLEPGRIYLAPANRHLLVTPRGVTLNSGPRENGFRPAVDPL